MRTVLNSWETVSTNKLYAHTLQQLNLKTFCSVRSIWRGSGYLSGSELPVPASVQVELAGNWSEGL